jgi:hypothetical protein
MRAITPIVLAIFFWVAELLTAIVFLTLLVPDTPLDLIWLAKPDAHNDLMLLRPASTLGFLLLSVAMGFAAVGCMRRRRWGWTLAVAIFAANSVGDAIRAATGGLAEGFFGVAVTLSILWWLTRPNVRALFA